MSDTVDDRTNSPVDRRQDPLDLVFGPLDQVAPGSDASTLDALASLHPIPEGGAILDLGCGPGRQTLALARALDRPVTAVDVNRSFLDRLIVRAEAAGLGEQVAVREASMVALDASPASVDNSISGRRPMAAVCRLTSTARISGSSTSKRFQ